MATAVIFPKLDEAMVSGTIVRWLKQDGEHVEKGEGILEVETEKVTFEVEADESGILSKVMAQEGDEVAVGTTIAFLLQSGEEAPEVPEPTTAPQELSPAAAPTASVAVPEALKEARDIKASPAARRMAHKHGIDIATVMGTGPGGRIVREDVLQALERGKSAAAPTILEEPRLAGVEVVPLSSMRKVIARRMTESFQVPHFYLTIEVDSRELEETRQRLLPSIEKDTGIRLTATDLLIKMVAKALEDNPAANCAYVDESVRLFKQIDIGLVAAVEGGLLVPVIRGANEKSLAEIAQARAELSQRAKDGNLSMAEMRASTFTITNLGMFGIDQFSAILQPPEAAILAVGRMAEKAVVREGAILARPMMTLTLSVDHRVLDGVIGSQFLNSLKAYIENAASFFNTTD